MRLLYSSFAHSNSNSHEKERWNLRRQGREEGTEDQLLKVTILLLSIKNCMHCTVDVKRKTLIVRYARCKFKKNYRFKINVKL